MITYPCYDDDPVYEDDQCSVNRMLYDPRIKPVSDHLSAIFMCIVNNKITKIATYTLLYIKAHGSESRGQEEAAYTHVFCLLDHYSELFTGWQL